MARGIAIVTIVLALIFSRLPNGSLIQAHQPIWHSHLRERQV